jgi:hypothetical protein
VSLQNTTRRQCGEFLITAIVEYTAIPEAKAKPAVALPSYLFHKLISVRVAVAAIFLSFSSGK